MALRRQNSLNKYETHVNEQLDDLVAVRLCFIASRPGLVLRLVLGVVAEQMQR